MEGHIIHKSSTNSCLSQTLVLQAVASKHNLEVVDPEMLDQMTEKSIESHACCIGQQGLGRHKDIILKVLSDSPLEVYRV